MKAMRTHKKMIPAGVLLLAAVCIGTLTAGDLNPPGPPTSGTMKTLDQVEPRIPIPTSAVPTGIFTISQSGSYYLAGDRYCNGNGIEINVDNVTIDLAGFKLVGPETPGYHRGINIGTHSNVEIRNGTVRNFYNGIYSASSGGQNNRMADVRALSNHDNGFYLPGKGTVVKDCTASGNGTTGIYTGIGSTIIGNAVSDNGVSSDNPPHGIRAGDSSIVSGNRVFSNGGTAAATVYGIRAGYACTVTGNTVYENGASTAAGTQVYSLLASTGSVISDNTVFNNGSSSGGSVFGIYSGPASVLRGNTAIGNGSSASGSVYGVYANGSTSVIGNTVCYNGQNASSSVWGIFLAGNNLADQNIVTANGLEASPAINMQLNTAGCVYGINVVE